MLFLTMKTVNANASPLPLRSPLKSLCAKETSKFHSGAAAAKCSKPRDFRAGTLKFLLCPQNARASVRWFHPTVCGEKTPLYNIQSEKNKSSSSRGITAAKFASRFPREAVHAPSLSAFCFREWLFGYRVSLTTI
jgi:hypothetical protein